MRRLIMLLFPLMLTACPGPRGYQGDQGLTGPATPAPVVTPTQLLINAVVDDENEYRLGIGQSPLSEGLTCTVQQTATGQWLSNTSPGYNAVQGVIAGGTNPSYTYLYTGNFNQPDSAGSIANTLLPVILQPFYINQNYKISCTGFIVVLEAGYYNFTTASDDGTILTVDGTVVVNNDGNHTITTKAGLKYLHSGVKAFNLLYAQAGGGNFAMVLTSNGSTIDHSFFYH